MLNLLFVYAQGTELIVALPETYALSPGGKEPATVVPVPFKPVDAAQARTGMKGGQKMTETDSGKQT